MTETLSYDDARGEGYLAESNRRFFHPLGLALAAYPDGTFVILDLRQDPEGWMFEGGDEERARKGARVAEIEAERRPAREAALGFWIQPLTTGIEDD